MEKIMERDIKSGWQEQMERKTDQEKGHWMQKEGETEFEQVFDAQNQN